MSSAHSLNVCPAQASVGQAGEKGVVDQLNAVESLNTFYCRCRRPHGATASRAEMSLTSWFLVSSGGTRHRLPREMIFVGRDDCELMLQSRSVDKQHAVINYETASDEHKVKDLGSLNGTFVNDVRIQEQMYITLKIDDKLRFGYDILLRLGQEQELDARSSQQRGAKRRALSPRPAFSCGRLQTASRQPVPHTNLFTVVRGELHVPEEALKHEKFTSQLQLSKKPSNGEPSKSPKQAKSPAAKPTKPAESKAMEGAGEALSKPTDALKGDDKMAGDISALHRGTPLYGQPSWWGDGDADDENSFKQETKTSGKKQENCGADGRESRRGEKGKDDGGLCSLGPEPSYFEIPTKEALSADSSIHEIPTKDTEGAAVAPATVAPATTAGSSAAAPSHASFTIEFDDTSPGKVTIRDHVSKHTADQRPRPRKAPPQPGGGGGELSTLQAAIIASESKVADWLAQNDPPLARVESTEDDSKSIKSDVPIHLNRLKGSKHEDGTQSDSENGAGLRFANRRAGLLQAGRGRAAPGGVSRTAFMIEFFDEDNPRKRRSYSFSQTAPLLGEGPSPMPPSRRAGVASSLAAVAPTAARLLLQQQRPAENPPSPGRSVGNQTSPDPTSVGQQTSPTDEPTSAPRPADKQPEDDQSDKGTYTIELENRNPEEEEARRMIDKVFGVEENQDPTRTGRPEHLQNGQTMGTGDTKKPGHVTSEILPEDLVAVGSPRWVSQWASLAANHTRTDPEGSGADTQACLQEKEADASESALSVKSAASAHSASSHAERKRRTLPQLPTEERASRASGAGRGRAPRAPPACSAPRSGRSRTPSPRRRRANRSRGSERPGPPATGGGAAARSPREEPPEPRRRRSKPALQALRPAGGQRGEAPGGGPQEARGRRPGEGRQAAGAAGQLHRGEAERRRAPGADPAHRQGPVAAGARAQRLGGQHGHRPAAEGHRGRHGLPGGQAARREQAGPPLLLGPRGRGRPGSISPESDVDTASTVSQAAGEGERRGAQKRRTLSSLHKEKSAREGARERLERKARPRPAPESRPEPPRPRPAQPGPRARRPSLDLTDDDLTSSLPHSTFSDVFSSDQETGPGRVRGQFTSSADSKAQESGKAGAKPGKSPQAPPSSAAAPPGKPVTLPRPRPTRASLLRRARLGDSDTDLADADRASVASEVSTTSSTSRPPSGRKAPSRIDMLAQPRRTRLGSLSARSDSEATVSRSAPTRMGADTALRLGLRAPPANANADGKPPPRLRANSVSKLSDAKAKPPAAHAAPSESGQPDLESSPAIEDLLANPRWRRLPPEYASTSEDEFGSNRNSPKHGRLRPGTSLRGVRLGGSAPGTPGGVALRHHRMREQEEYIRDWTAHSEEIARLFPCVRRISQDLAKDLAILAREIHDVAGEIDSVSSSGTAPSTTVSTAATTPGSAIDTREELVDRVFDESLNFRKIPPIVQTKAPEINGRPVELRPRAPDNPDPQAALRRRTWNRDEAVLDSLLLTSVSQLSAKIRQSVDKTAGKIRILFKDKDRNWDEIESKLRAESDIPLLKTSNKEISSILLELKRVEKQLQVINVMVDPDGTLDALNSLGLTSPILHKPRTSAATPGPQGPLPGNEAVRTPLVPAPAREMEQDLALRLSRQNPSGEESSAARK
ncbi:hypothetical protein AAFF_G00158250 [Aldrovandia affinis]|uniref:FHA domain-containing protein n=1 Tax=Aldrovandia affinis TaxID=143900 RepID=A0AAD7W909_9TELE|nr:hypothetical protein AAFF_G00158250 [Aldrovandia affinis]